MKLSLTISAAILAASMSGVNAAGECGIGDSAAVMPSYIVGHTCIRFTEDQRQLYMMGFLGAVSVSNALGAPAGCVGAYVECTKNFSVDQSARIFLKYMEAHPEKLHYACNILALNALNVACTQLGFDFRSDR